MILVLIAIFVIVKFLWWIVGIIAMVVLFYAMRWLLARSSPWPGEVWGVTWGFVVLLWGVLPTRNRSGERRRGVRRLAVAAA